MAYPPIFRIPTFISEGFWIGFGIVTAIVALLLGTRFLTQFLTPQEYGRLALAISLTTLSVQVFGDPAGKTAIRFYSYWCSVGKPYGFLQNIVKSLVIATGCISLVSIGTMMFITFYERSSENYFVLISGAFAILLVFNRIALALEDAARQRRFRGLIQGGFEIFRFTAAIGLILIFAQPDAETVLTGFVLAAILILVAHGMFLRMLLHSNFKKKSSFKKMIPKEDRLSMRSFQLPLIFSNICVWVVMMSERWILNYFGESGDVGGYAAVYQLAFVPMLFVSNFFILFIEPILYQVTMLDRGTTESLDALKVNNLTAIGILIFSLASFFIFLFWHPMVGYIFLGIEFRTYSWMFPWLLLAGGCFAAAQQLLLKLNFDLRTDLLAALWGTMALITVFAYGICTLFWQLKGMLVAIVSVHVLFVIFLLFFLVGKNRSYKISKSIYPS